MTRGILKFNHSASTTLLLVDDDTHQLELRALALKMAGYKVLTADSAIEALSKLAQDHGREVDVAVVDYDMPMMNGCVLADYVRARYPELKIILYSGAPSIPEDDMRAVDMFVPKSNGIRSLLNHITELTGVGTPGHLK